MIAALGLIGKTFDVAAGLYSGKELAQTLSLGGVKVVSSPEVAERGFALRLRRRTLAEIDGFLNRSSGVRLLAKPDGSWILDADADAESLDRRLFNAYAAKIDGAIREAVTWATSLAAPGYGSSIQEVNAALAKRYGFTRPSRGYETALDTVSGPESEKNGWRLVAGLAGSSAFDCRVTPPAFEWARNGGSIAQLTRADDWYFGNLFTWRDRQDVAPWVRHRAVKWATTEEENLAKDASLSPEQRAARLQAYASRNLLIHRLHFEPRDGRLWTEYAKVGPGQNDGWYQADVAFDFIPHLDLDLLLKLYRDDAERAALTNRLRASDQALATAKLPASFEKRNISDRLLAQARASDVDVCAEIQPVRDRCHRSSVPTSLAPAIGLDASSGKGRRWNVTFYPGSSFVDFASDVPAFTAEIINGAFLLRDEWRFLDRRYKIPMTECLRIRRATSACASLADAVAVAKTGKDATIRAALFAGFDLGPGFAENWPCLIAYGATDFGKKPASPEVRKTLLRRLRDWCATSVWANTLYRDQRYRLFLGVEITRIVTDPIPTDAAMRTFGVDVTSVDGGQWQDQSAFMARLGLPDAKR